MIISPAFLRRGFFIDCLCQNGLTVTAPMVSYCAFSKMIPKSSWMSMWWTMEWISRFAPSENMLKKQGIGNWKDMVLAKLAWPGRQDYHYNPHDKWGHTSWHQSPGGDLPRCHVQTHYIVSYASRLVLMSNCSPSVSRTTSSVFNCGLQ